MALLELHGCMKIFGGLTAVNELSLSIEAGEIVGMIGPNGAGKTTVFNCVTGASPVTWGRINFDGKDISRTHAWAINQLGIARTFQNIRPFPELTVLENVMTAGTAHARYGFMAAMFRSPLFVARETHLTENAMRLLSYLDLEAKAGVLARHLPYGEQRRLEIARALATRPRLLLLDEPAAGLNVAETAALMALIRRLRAEFNLTVFLIEHDMRLVMGVCERVVVLDYGVVIAEGPPEVIQRNPKVIEAYLGEVA